LLQAVPSDFKIVEEISSEKRVIEEEEISYRVVADVIEIEGSSYLLEIGRSLNTIEKIDGMFFQIAMGSFFYF